MALFVVSSKAGLLQPRVSEDLPDCSQVGDDELVYFPHPTNCSKFYQCAHQRPVEMECPKGLEWNVETNTCLYPEEASCSTRLLRSNRCENVSDWENVLFPNPDDCSTYFHCLHQQPFLEHCPEDLHFSPNESRCEYPDIAGCQVGQVGRNDFSSCENVPDDQDVLLPNPKNCSTYIQCVNQKPMVRNCSKGLEFNSELRECTWPWESNCQENSCKGVSEWEDVLLPNPEDCETYIQCVHQQPVVRPCPSGLHWSVQMNRCEWPSIANCSLPAK